jgi:type II secretory pathway pseudopilin PulG
MKITKLILLVLININLCFGQTINPPKNKLTQSEIENKSISELWLLRNSIFAKYDRTFKTYELHAFFMKQPWYKPSEDFRQSDLSETDLYNINLLVNQENKLRENDYLTIEETKQVKFENVYNTFQYPDFNNVEKEKLSKNGFLVYPTNQDQLFHIYENNDYLGIPSFISVDAVLQLYHLYFDMTLRNIETKYLSSKLEILLDQLINELAALQNTMTKQNIKEAIDLNLAFLGISQYFIKDGESEIKGNLKDVALQEIEKCKNHTGYQRSELLDRMFDYSQYIPRGHYTRSEELKRYFLSMMWLGNAGMEVTNERNILSSVLITSILYNKTYQGKPLIKLWEDIYEPTVFYVGLSDDTGPVEIKQAMDIIFPGVKMIEQFDNNEKLMLLAQSLPSEKISGHGLWGSQKKQFRLMGQRFIPDSYIFHRLTSNKRKMPNSLDIMAGFGNEKAYDLMMNDYKSSWAEYPTYPDTLNQIIEENKGKTEEDWTQNLYYHWLYNLKTLYEIKNKAELPFFMTTDSWDIKTLNTTLASWAELRHNTILYAKQSVAAECGGGEDEIKVWIPEPPKGYVEPNTEFYDRMLALMNFTTQGLTEKRMLDNRVKYIGNEFVDLLNFLKSISEKENRKEKLSLEEYNQIQKLGSLLDNLTLRVLSEDAYEWWQVEGPDKNMPVIADVHTANDKALEVGVGKAHAIYVIVEIEGKLKLTRGAIFSFYEFPWPSSNRLTDEKWQEMLRNGNAPEQPEWINYKSNQKQEKRLTPLYKPDGIPDSSTEPGWKIIYYDTGC